MKSYFCSAPFMFGCHFLSSFFNPTCLTHMSDTKLKNKIQDYIMIKNT